MEFQVRPAKQEDATAISRVVIAALHGSNAQDYSAGVITRVERSFAPDAINTLLVQRKVFVALLGDKIAGTASLDIGVVRSVFVDPAYQANGVGRQLMEVVHATAIGTGVRTLRVPSSITARGFYTALGHRKIRDEFHGSERTIVMEKQLAG